MTRYLSAFLNEGIPGIPKTISPKTHKLLDYLTTGAFLVAGAFMWASNRRAAAAAFVNGAFVLSYSLCTDYDGDGRRPVSFETHGKLDVVQAGLAAAAPHILRFADEKKALFFPIQAMNEGAVLAMTDFAAGQRSEARIRDLAA
jgi:hypothetical protein